MVDYERLSDFVGGCICVGLGLSSVITRRTAIGDDDDFWVYGWRAVLIGCAALAGAVLFFASAFGFIHVDHS